MLKIFLNQIYFCRYSNINKKYLFTSRNKFVIIYFQHLVYSTLSITWQSRDKLLNNG